MITTRINARFATLMILMILMIIATPRGVSADTITLRGSSIPLRSCVIQDFKSGRLFFRDGGNRRQRREIEDVVAVGFTGLPALDEAERLLAADDSDAGLARMLEALVAADSEPERVWIHMRLSQVHDERDELVPAAGHAAAVFLLRDESFWQRIEPVSTNTSASFAATTEAIARLNQANESLRDRSLKRVAKSLISIITPAHEALAAAHKDAPVAPGATESGVAIERIRAGLGRAGLPRAGVVKHVPERVPESPSSSPAVSVDPPRGSAPGRTGRQSPAGSRARSAGDRADAIETALADGRSADALAMCERIARRPGDRDLARFLYQYGRSLRAAGRAEDASVMFLRVAVHYDASPFAGPALLDAAIICRDVFANADAAERLARRAIEGSDAADDVVRERARGILATLNPGKNR